MKKFVAIAIALVTVLSLLCLTACNKGVEYGNDTFEGALSETSYDNQEEAVKAFLSNEIAGEAADANLVSYEEKKDLTNEEIDKLALDNEEKESIVSAKEVDISYSRDTVRNMADGADENTFVFTVYILEFTSEGSEIHEFKYYVPKAKNGDVLTRSYYKDLLDSEKYENCTQEYVSKVTSEGGGQKLSVEQKFVIKVAGNKASMEMKMVNPSSLQSGKVEYLTVKGYFEYDEATDNFKTYLSTDGSTFTLDSTNAFKQFGITNMKSFATMNIPKVDFSYYEKTEFGFKVQDAFLKKYLSAAMSSIAPGSKVDNSTLNFYVLDGKIGKLEANVKATVQASGVEVTTENNETLIFKDFGTTTVETPKLA